jgi:hypothetical protein
MKQQNKKGVRPELSQRGVTAGFERLCSWTFHFAVEAEGPVFNSLQKLCQSRGFYSEKAENINQIRLWPFASVRKQLLNQ